MTQREVPPGREVEPGQGVFGISVTADLVGTGVQNLRLYERRGLLEPSRSAGGTRLYSADDIARLHRITGLLAAGLNLAGIARVLELEDDNTRLRADHEKLLEDRVREDRLRADRGRRARRVRGDGDPPPG